MLTSLKDTILKEVCYERKGLVVSSKDTCCSSQVVPAQSTDVTLDLKPFWGCFSFFIIIIRKKKCTLSLEPTSLLLEHTLKTYFERYEKKMVWRKGIILIQLSRSMYGFCNPCPPSHPYTLRMLLKIIE